MLSSPVSTTVARIFELFVASGNVLVWTFALLVLYRHLQEKRHREKLERANVEAWDRVRNHAQREVDQWDQDRLVGVDERAEFDRQKGDTAGFETDRDVEWRSCYTDELAAALEGQPVSGMLSTWRAQGKDRERGDEDFRDWER